jgi:16S rRNA (guanine966-N2)-methyltransferase
MGRVRQALFDMLAGLSPASPRVLDLYAGTGALGIEALSRGASRADFVERNRESCEEIRVNLARLGLREQGRVYCQDVPRALTRLTEPYDLIFMDPPYADSTAPKVLDKLLAGGLCAEEALLVLERSKHGPSYEVPAGLTVLKEKRYGDTLVSIFSLEPAPQDESPAKG